MRWPTARLSVYGMKGTANDRTPHHARAAAVP
jgi:hypothetical protein